MHTHIQSTADGTIELAKGWDAREAGLKLAIEAFSNRYSQFRPEELVSLAEVFTDFLVNGALPVKPVSQAHSTSVKA
jgi:hypothetical protein